MVLRAGGWIRYYPHPSNWISQHQLCPHHCLVIEMIVTIDDVGCRTCTGCMSGPWARWNFIFSRPSFHRLRTLRLAPLVDSCIYLKVFFFLFYNIYKWLMKLLCLFMRMCCWNICLYILVLILLCLFVFVGMSYVALQEALSRETCEGVGSWWPPCCQMETAKGSLWSFTLSRLDWSNGECWCHLEVVRGSEGHYLFHDIYWYVGLIMVSSTTKCFHLLEIVLRL